MPFNNLLKNIQQNQPVLKHIQSTKLKLKFLLMLIISNIF